MPLANKTAGWRRAEAPPPRGMHLDEPSQYLSIGPTGTKAVIRIFGSSNSAAGVIAKASPSHAKADESLISAFRVLSSLQSRPSEERELPFSTPTPVESFSQAGWHFTVETAAPGRPLSELIFLRSHRGRLAFLRNELAQCVEIAAKLPHILKGTVAPRKIDPEWYEIPKGMDLGPGVERTLATESAKWAKQELCAHGDFTIENVFWDKAAGKASVIDWDLPIQGVPPLYDAFTLLFSSLPALSLEHHSISFTEERLTQQFQAAFFSTGPWATATREILQRISTTKSGADSDIWQELVLSLVIRTRYFLWRQPSLGRQFSRLLEYAVQHEPLFVCGARPALRDPHRLRAHELPDSNLGGALRQE
ncbi:MAG TPA: phosphotransferase [Candidatus Sulfotelmatobacter sp.]